MRRMLPLLAILGVSAPVVTAPSLSGSGLEAQVAAGATQEPELIDRVIAVVGDSVVLLTELQREHLLARSQGIDLSESESLDNLIDLQVILQAAARDSTVIPTAADVDRRVDAELERIRGDYGSEAAFQQALAEEGLTVSTYRDQLREQIRTRLIQTTFMQRMAQSVPPPAVSEAEMRAFYDAHRDELQQRPEILTLHQVLIRSGASDEAWARARQVADSLHALLVRGADFDALARAHSDDPGSAAQGGDLGWMQRGGLVAEFEQAAFSLMDGSMSPPVRTEFGYHVIRAERSRPGEKRLRHILISPEVAPADLERARALAEDVAGRIRSGENALALARTHGDPELPREFPLYRGQEAEQLPQGYAQHLFGVQQGEVVGPFEVNLRGRAYYVVIYVAQVREAGEFTFEDVRDGVRTTLRDQKLRERILSDLRARTYIEVRY